MVAIVDERGILRYGVIILLFILSYMPVYGATIGPCCPLNQELRYLLQPPSGANFKYQIRY
ncbi:MAG: hypothetical protein JSW32_03375, partial [Deltaproteobacteria bacterium]